MMAMLTSTLSTSVIATALPTIVGDLGGQDKLSWVASATLLVCGAVAAWNFALIADEYGVREGGLPFTVLLGLGVAAFMVSLPGFFASRSRARAPRD